MSTVGIRHSKTELELRSSSVEAGSTATELLLLFGLGWICDSVISLVVVKRARPRRAGDLLGSAKGRSRCTKTTGESRVLV